MTHRLFPLLALSALTLLVACGPADDDLPDGVLHAPLVNGTLDPGHPSVGALVTDGGLCTATLVGQRTVLTAAHCVQPGAEHQFFVANTFFQAESAQRHPSYSAATASSDVGLVVLKQAPPVKYSSISTRPPAKGQTLTLVGFGATGDSGNGSGTKRVGYNTVAFLTDQRIVISGSGGSISNLCFGDSGGPTFVEIDGQMVQVGVHSTITGSCGVQGHDMRVDLFATWIRTTAGGDVSEDGRPSPLDDTTPPAVSITSPAAAASVYPRLTVKATITDDQQVVGAELLVDGAPVVSLTQGPYDFELSLTPGEHRIRVEAQDAVGNVGHDEVVVNALPPAQFGDLCDANQACASGLCATQHELAFCSQLCDPATNPCPGQADCLPAGGGKYACGAPADRTASSGGCSVGADPTVGGWIGGGLLLLVLGLRRRRINAAPRRA